MTSSPLLSPIRVLLQQAADAFGSTPSAVPRSDRDSPVFAPVRHIAQRLQHQRSPSGLVTRAEPLARVAVEELVEQDQVAECRVLRVPGLFAVRRPPTGPVRMEEPKEP